MSDFQTALSLFITAINNGIQQYAEEFDHMTYSETDPASYFKPVWMTTGKKNVKIWIGSGCSTSIYCFVDIETGDILKAASYKAPAKGARGNIYNPDSYANRDLSGTGWLYR